MRSPMVRWLAVALFFIPAIAQADFWGAALGAAGGGMVAGLPGAFVGGLLGYRATSPRQVVNNYYVPGGGSSTTVVYEQPSVDMDEIERRVQAGVTESITLNLPRIEGAVRSSAYAGARDGTIEGMRIFFLRLQQSELAELQAGNAALFQRSVPVLVKQLQKNKNSDEAVYHCASFCGGYNEQGKLVFTPIFSQNADRDQAFAALVAQCTDGRIPFRDLRLMKSAQGNVYQKLVLSRDQTVCESKTETTLQDAFDVLAPRQTLSQSSPAADTLDPKVVIPGWGFVHSGLIHTLGKTPL